MAESVSKTFEKTLLRLFGSSGVLESNPHQRMNYLQHKNWYEILSHIIASRDFVCQSPEVTVKSSYYSGGFQSTLTPEYGGGVEHLGRCKLNTIVAEN